MTELFISDLDGTLLQSSASLSSFAKQQLTAMLREDLPFTVATARTIYSVEPILEGLPLRYPLILQNGAVLYDPMTKKYCHAAIIEKESAAAMFDCLSAHGLNGFVYCLAEDTLQCCYTELTTPAMQSFYRERKDRYDKPFRRVEQLSRLAGDAVVYCSLRGAEHLLRPAAEELQRIAGVGVSFYKDVYEADCWYLELAAHTATKYHGVQRLRELTGAETITAFGDNDNDLPMFSAADTRVAVANATQNLKNSADLVIGTNGEDAVIRYLMNYHTTRKE